MHGLRGCAALVTGAGHRIGREIARALARSGAHVALHAHAHAADARDLVEELGALGVRAQSFQADLSTWDGAAQLGARVLAEFGPLDILVNSASSFVRAPYLETSEAQFDLALNVNLKGPYALSQVVAGDMIARRAGLDSAPGAIINIVDEGIHRPTPAYAAHGISKAALLALTRLQAASLGPHVRANAICPGYVLKPDGLSEERWDAARAGNPLRALGSPEQVAECVIFLATGPEFINGDCIVLDGGEQWWRVKASAA